MKEKKKFKIKNLFKSRVFFFVIGALIFGTIGVSAASVLYGKDVTYDNSSSGLGSTNLQDALDELYEQAKNAGGCPDGYVCSALPVKNLIVTTGSGLYADSVTSGRYIYRGSSVNNYITFNSETWRIISVESDGTIKIIRNEQISSTQAWDTKSNRNQYASTYCARASDFGCDAWAATANLVNMPSTFMQYYPNGNTSDSTNYSGKVVTDASLNTYLNGTYYSGLSSTAKAKVVKGTFNVSTPGDKSDTETLEVDAQQEKQYQWQGYVALMNVTELLRASTNSACTSLSAGHSSSNAGNCNTNNWLWPTFNTSSEEWTLSPYVYSNRNYVWTVISGGFVTNISVHNAYSVRPVLHLSADITLSGSGTSSDPYQITE